MKIRAWCYLRLTSTMHSTMGWKNKDRLTDKRRYAVGSKEAVEVACITNYAESRVKAQQITKTPHESREGGVVY